MNALKISPLLLILHKRAVMKPLSSTRFVFTGKGSSHFPLYTEIMNRQDRTMLTLKIPAKIDFLQCNNTPRTMFKGALLFGDMKFSAFISMLCIAEPLTSCSKLEPTLALRVRARLRYCGCLICTYLVEILACMQ